MTPEARVARRELNRIMIRITAQAEAELGQQFQTRVAPIFDTEVDDITESTQADITATTNLRPDKTRALITTAAIASALAKGTRP